MEGEAVTFTYGALALVPPVLAIVLAIWKRQVIVSLTIGVFAGATIINHWNPLTGLLDTFSKYIVAKSLADAWNVGVIVFCLAIGGLVGVMSRIGGTQAIAESIAKKARDTRSTLLATALMGIAIFFDDYANSMIVGNTMRPITDKYNIAREKLANLPILLTPQPLPYLPSVPFPHGWQWSWASLPQHLPPWASRAIPWLHS